MVPFVENNPSIKLSKIIVILLLLGVKTIDSDGTSDGSISVSPEAISVSLGERVEVNCSVHNISRPFMMRWDKYLNNIWRLNVNTPVVKTYSPSDNTLLLVIINARPQDDARYRCVVNSAAGKTLKKEMQISVRIGEMKLPHMLCAHFKMFHCKSSSRYKIFCSYVCDGVENCPDGSDEEFCPGTTVPVCTNKFRCNNSLCLGKEHVCNQVNDCGDNSDEENCDYLRGPTILPPGVQEAPEDDQLSWLKTTVYTVIACTVGVVLFISVVVIAVFRIKMKRAAARRAARRAERRSRSSHGNGSRTNRSHGQEAEPFIPGHSPTHLGNIIVNVNNGVQYVPNVILQAPPSYAEVLAENMESPGRHSPPPIYTTIDRNPYRFSGAGDGADIDETAPLSQAEDRSDCINVSETVTQNVSSNAHSEPVLENQSAVSTVNEDNQNTDSTESQNIAQLDCVDSCIDTTQHDLSAEATNDNEVLETTNLSNSLKEDIHEGDKTEKMACRPKQLPVQTGCRPKQIQVRHGEIVLDGSSSGSSSPETVNRNTQTNPADYNVEHQNSSDYKAGQQNSTDCKAVNHCSVKTAQIQVQDGQIVLASDEQEVASPGADSEPLETEGVSTPGQLEVIEGQIVFKS